MLIDGGLWKVSLTDNFCLGFDTSRRYHNASGKTVLGTTQLNLLRALVCRHSPCSRETLPVAGTRDDICVVPVLLMYLGSDNLYPGSTGIYSVLENIVE